MVRVYCSKKTMKNYYLTLLLLFFTPLLFGQQMLKELLQDQQKLSLDSYPASVVAFANANYEQAYQLLEANKATAFNDSELWLFKAAKYSQNRILQSRYAKRTQRSERATYYDFYLKHDPMRIELSTKTTIPLQGNRFTAVLNDTDTLRVLFDTGGSGIGIKQKFVDQYNFARDTTMVRKGYVPAMKIENKQSPTVIPKLSIGTMDIYNAYAHYSYDHKGANMATDDFDIIIGLDVFVGLIGSVDLQYEQGLISFSKAPTEAGEKPFLFFDNKPITSFTIGDMAFVTLIDSGSPTDIIAPSYYKKNFTKKVEKEYRGWSYNVYTVPLEQHSFDINVADYNDDFRLTLNNLPIDLILGTSHKRAYFNLETNRMIFE